MKPGTIITARKDPDDCWIEDPVSGCWNWTENTDTDGYGLVSARQPTGFPTKVKAHRLMYERHVGPIPAGKILRHICDNRSCVRPDHLVPGTNKDNTQDMIDRNRYAGSPQKGKPLNERQRAAVSESNRRRQQPTGPDGRFVKT